MIIVAKKQKSSLPKYIVEVNTFCVSLVDQTNHVCVSRSIPRCTASLRKNLSFTLWHACNTILCLLIDVSRHFLHDLIRDPVDHYCDVQSACASLKVTFRVTTPWLPSSWRRGKECPCEHRPSWRRQTIDKLSNRCAISTTATDIGASKLRHRHSDGISWNWRSNFVDSDNVLSKAHSRAVGTSINGHQISHYSERQSHPHDRPLARSEHLHQRTQDYTKHQDSYSRRYHPLPSAFSRNTCIRGHEMCRGIQNHIILTVSSPGQYLHQRKQELSRHQHSTSRQNNPLQSTFLRSQHLHQPFCFFVFQRFESTTS